MLRHISDEKKSIDTRVPVLELACGRTHATHADRGRYDVLEPTAAIEHHVEGQASALGSFPDVLDVGELVRAPVSTLPARRRCPVRRTACSRQPTS
ncbi:MAG: hypothetical protein R3B07_14055 [Polyangiaceae bacterium]